MIFSKFEHLFQALFVNLQHFQGTSLIRSLLLVSLYQIQTGSWKLQTNINEHGTVKHINCPSNIALVFHRIRYDIIYNGIVCILCSR
jgi:hypothetical protein